MQEPPSQQESVEMEKVVENTSEMMPSSSPITVAEVFFPGDAKVGPKGHKFVFISSIKWSKESASNITPTDKFSFDPGHRYSVTCFKCCSREILPCIEQNCPHPNSEHSAFIVRLGGNMSEVMHASYNSDTRYRPPNGRYLSSESEIGPDDEQNAHVQALHIMKIKQEQCDSQIRNEETESKKNLEIWQKNNSTAWNPASPPPKMTTLRTVGLSPSRRVMQQLFNEVPPKRKPGSEERFKPRGAATSTTVTSLSTLSKKARVPTNRSMSNSKSVPRKNCGTKNSPTSGRRGNSGRPSPKWSKSKWTKELQEKNATLVLEIKKLKETAAATITSAPAAQKAMSTSSNFKSMSVGEVMDSEVIGENNIQNVDEDNTSANSHNLESSDQGTTTHASAGTTQIQNDPVNQQTITQEIAGTDQNVNMNSVRNGASGSTPNVRVIPFQGLSQQTLHAIKGYYARDWDAPGPRPFKRINALITYVEFIYKSKMGVRYNEYKRRGKPFGNLIYLGECSREIVALDADAYRFLYENTSPQQFVKQLLLGLYGPDGVAHRSLEPEKVPREHWHLNEPPIPIPFDELCLIMSMLDDFLIKIGYTDQVAKDAPKEKRPKPTKRELLSLCTKIISNFTKTKRAELRSDVGTATTATSTANTSDCS